MLGERNIRKFNGILRNHAAMVGIGVLHSTGKAKIVRNFLLAYAIADVGHLYAVYTVIHQSSESVFFVLRRIFMH